MTRYPSGATMLRGVAAGRARVDADMSDTLVEWFVQQYLGASVVSTELFYAARGPGRFAPVPPTPPTLGPSHVGTHETRQCQVHSVST